jgi:hypothetical protein
MQIKNITKNKQANWLLYIGGVLLPLTLFSLIFLKSDSQEMNSRQLINSKFELYAFAAIIIAPILEELVFRGIFSKTKLLRIFSLITLPSFVFYIADGFLTYATIFAYFVFSMLYILKNKPKVFPIMFLLNSVLFSLAHYKITDFSSLFSSVPFFIQFSLGLILIWIIINFGLLRAILFHFLWNLIAFGLMLFPLQFVDDKVQEIQTEEYTMIINKVPRYSKANSTFAYNSSGLKINHMELTKVLKIINAKKDEDVFPATPFMKYNLEIKFNDKRDQHEMNEILFKSLVENEFFRVVD